jgi:hypothetical protein
MPPELSSPQVAAGTTDPGTLLPAGVPVREALVTLAVLVVCLVGQKLSIPTVDKAAASGSLAVANSIFVLGVQPLLSGFVLVELAALLIPSWRRLRTGGPTGREKLRRASLRLGMALALGQAFFMAVAFEKTSHTVHGPGLRMITALILLGATAVLIALARIVDEAGLGGGFPILLLAFTLPGITRPLGEAFSAVGHYGVGGSALQTEIIAMLLVVGATLWFFSPYCLPGTEPWDHPALVSRPACGVAPLSIVAGIMAYVAGLFRVYSGRELALPGQFDLVPLVFSIIAAIGFAYLFNLPSRLSGVWKALSPLPPQRWPRIKPAMLEAVLFIGFVVLVRIWLVPRTGVVLVILVTGIIADLVREWRARTDGVRLVPIWEIHQVYAVPPAMRLLQEQGFHPFVKGLRLRSLLQFYGPYAPVLVLVPAAEAQSAYALIKGRWPVLDQKQVEKEN